MDKSSCFNRHHSGFIAELFVLLIATEKNACCPPTLKKQINLILLLSFYENYQT